MKVIANSYWNHESLGELIPTAEHSDRGNNLCRVSLSKIAAEELALGAIVGEG